MTTRVAEAEDHVQNGESTDEESERPNFENGLAMPDTRTLRQRRLAKELKNSGEDRIPQTPKSLTNKKQYTTSQKTFEEMKQEYDEKDLQRQLDEARENQEINFASPPIATEKWPINIKEWCGITVVFLVILGLVVLLGMRFAYPLNKTVMSKETLADVTWSESDNYFFHKLKLLKNKFSFQSEETWRMLYAAVSSTLRERAPKQPSSIILLSPPGVSRVFSNCFSRKLAQFINVAHRMKATNTRKITTSSLINAKEMDSAYFDDGKTITAIHDDLKKYLEDSKAVIVHDVDRIEREDHLMIFHGFCDNSVAHDKRATYLFLITSPGNVSAEWIHSNGENIVQNILNDSWKGVLTEDKRPSVISRIASYIILLNEGDICK